MPLDVKGGLCFANLNEMLQASEGFGRNFILTKWLKRERLAASDVFKMTDGINIIHTYYYHPGDVDVEDAEAINHYITYNAGTRMLFLFPEVRAYAHIHMLARSHTLSTFTQVLVLEDSDIEDIPAFVAKLRQVPFQTRINTDAGSFVRKVRRLFVHNRKEALSLPLAHPQHVNVME